MKKLLTDVATLALAVALTAFVGSLTAGEPLVVAAGAAGTAVLKVIVSALNPRDEGYGVTRKTPGM